MKKGKELSAVLWGLFITLVVASLAFELGKDVYQIIAGL